MVVGTASSGLAVKLKAKTLKKLKDSLDARFKVLHFLSVNLNVTALLA